MIEAKDRTVATYRLAEPFLQMIGDSGFSALLFLNAMRRARVTAITRLRLDAVFYEPAPPRRPSAIRCPRTTGARLPMFAATLADKETP